MKYQDLVSLEKSFRDVFRVNIWDYYNKYSGFSSFDLEYDLVHKSPIKELILTCPNNSELATKVLNQVDKRDVIHKIQELYGNGSYDLIRKASFITGAYRLIRELGTETQDNLYLIRYIESRSYGINPVRPHRSEVVFVGDLAWEKSTKSIVHLPSGLPVGGNNYSRSKAVSIMKTCLSIPGLSLKQPSLECLTKLGEIVNQ